MYVGRFFIGFTSSLVIGLIAYRRHSLSTTGVDGLLLIGTTLFVTGGWIWFTTLLAFFVSSSVFTLYRQQDKVFLADLAAKPGPRDVSQALADGGIGALIGVVHLFQPHKMLFAAFLGCIAAVSADTWATELGALSRSRPRQIATWKQDPPGTSGGIPVLGVAASIAGVLLIALVTLLLDTANLLLFGQNLVSARWWSVLLPIVLGGLSGSLFDSLLGVSVQASYYCERCKKETERIVHTCGEKTEHIKGWKWLNNEWVNCLCGGMGGLTSVGSRRQAPAC